MALAAVMLLASACTKVETGSRFSDIPMSFRSYAPRTTTSAPVSKVDTGSFVSGTTLPDTTNFGVFAFYQEGVIDSGTPATWNASRKPNYMFNQRVSVDGGNYSYSPVKYWPANEENTISFWAYYPYYAWKEDNSGALKFYESDGTTRYTANSSGIPVVKYTVPSATDQQYDILFDSFDQKNKTYWNCLTEGTVNLDFHHALALVEFQIIEGTGAVINSMSITNLLWSGTCTDPTTRSWTTDPASEATFAIADVEVKSNIICAMIMMPQTISASANLTVNYDITFQTADPSTDDILYKDNAGSALLRSTGITEWQAGKHYVYRITANYERIEFEEGVAVSDDWTIGNSNISVPE